jgi:hypothetical protein
LKAAHLSFGNKERLTFEESSKIESEDFDEFGSAYRKKSKSGQYQKQFVPTLNLE